MMVVTIHPANRDLLTVDANLAVLYTDASKTSDQRCELTLITEQLDDEAISMRVFG